MLRSTHLFAAGLVVLAMLSAVSAQAPSSFEKRNYNYSEWTKGRFSEVVTVTNPGRMIFLAGIGAEEEGSEAGVIRHKGDFLAQCRYSYDKIQRLLARHGATVNDIVKMVTYVTDIRYIQDYGTCRVEVFGKTGVFPAHTFLNISQLAWPGMMLEIDVTAMVQK
jgi:enamine deaminase RidA (YjgF/YER057c/UK114 family)